MINESDIEAFREDNEAALKAAHEYARRAQKGLPADRWCDGSAGARLVAQGIHAMNQILDAQTATLIVLMGEAHQRGEDAMRLHTKDSKYSEAGQ